MQNWAQLCNHVWSNTHIISTPILSILILSNNVITLLLLTIVSRSVILLVYSLCLSGKSRVSYRGVGALEFSPPPQPEFYPPEILKLSMVMVVVPYNI